MTPNKYHPRRSLLRMSTRLLVTIALSACSKTIASKTTPVTKSADAPISANAILQPLSKIPSATATSILTANPTQRYITEISTSSGVLSPSTATGLVTDPPPTIHLSTTFTARVSHILPTPHSASLGPLIHIWQTLNNCGPASIAEVLSYWGIQRTQAQVQAILRADDNPHGMVPYGVPAYARSLGLQALLGPSGTDALIKAFVANGIPPIVNQWVSMTDHVGHYRPIEAFDDTHQIFISSDPYLGPRHAITYTEFSQIWATNSNRFMLLYPPAKQPLVNAILTTTGWNKQTAYQTDLAKIQRRIALHQASRDGSSDHWAGHAALAIAWDYLELGNIPAAQLSLKQAQDQHANTVVVGWITQAIATNLI